MLPTYVWDPTATDPQSQVRGIGRYMQMLHECFDGHFHFTSELGRVPFDSVLIHPFFNLLQPPGLPLRRAKIQIAVIHDIIPYKYPTHFPSGTKGRARTIVNKLDLKNYQAIITPSAHVKQDLVRMLRVPSSRIHPIYSGITHSTAASTVSKHIQEMTQSPYALYVGDVTWNKNIATIASAVDDLPINMIWVGKTFTTTPNKEDPWQAEFAHWKARTYRNKRSITPGYVSDEELAYLYSHAVCNVLASHDEGFGYSFAEAALHSCPSVLSDIPVFHETAQTCALFANPNDPEAIGRCIQQYVRDEKMRKQMGRMAQARALTFTNEQYKAQVLHLIRTISP